MPLDALLRAVWVGRWRILLLSTLVYAVGAAAILTWPRRYVAQAVVAPAETTGIAASALLAHPAQPMSGAMVENRLAGHFAVYLDALRSAEAAAMLARETPLLDHLTALRAEGPMGRARRALGLRLEAELDDAMAWLRRSLSATQGVATVTFTLALAHRDREAALDALLRLHALAEAKVRADLATVARRRVAAIEQRLGTERDVFLRNTLYELLAAQQRAVLIAAADEAVAARLVSAPMVGIRPVLPNRALLLALLAVAAPLAVAVGALCVVLLQAPPVRSPWPSPGRRQMELPLDEGGVAWQRASGGAD